MKKIKEKKKEKKPLRVIGDNPMDREFWKGRSNPWDAMGATD